MPGRDAPSTLRLLPAWPSLAWTNPGPGVPRVLGLNPWIEDFAAYNLWLRPAGLLACLDMLRACGCGVALLDCLDRTWHDMPWPEPTPTGAGRFPKTQLAAPLALKNIPRAFSRYGLPEPAVANALAGLEPEPDLILITCLMTYWYSGAEALLRVVRRIWPKTPVVLGGVYATLCPDHAAARFLATGLADAVIAGPLEQPANWRRLWSLLGQAEPPPLPPEAGLSLAHDLYPAPRFAPILGSRGCPFDCAYCASRALHKGYRRRRAGDVRRDFFFERARGVANFAFHDDALLLDPDAWLIPLLRAAIDVAPGACLHAPNALHLRYLKKDVCVLLRQAGLATVRLGLESADFQDRLDEKIGLDDWKSGVDNLLAAGFAPERIGVYVLFGLPDQEPESVLAAIRLVREQGLRPYLTQYSPIPGSALFARAAAVSPFPLEEEPLYQNNSLWPCVPEGFTWTARERWRKAQRG